MYRLSEFIGKETIVLSNGESGGTISSVFFDVRLRILKFIELIDDESEDRKMVAFRGILNNAGEAVVIRSNANIVDAVYEGLIKAPMNLPCYNQDGKSLGMVSNIVMEGNKIMQYITDTIEIEAATLLVASNDLLIFNDTGEAIKKPANKKIEGIRKEQIKKRPIRQINNNDSFSDDEFGDENFNYIKSSDRQTQASLLHDKKAFVKHPSSTPPICGVYPQVRDGGSRRPPPPDEYYQFENDSIDIHTISTPEKISEDNTSVHRSPIKNSSIKNKYAFLLGLHLLKDIYNNNGQLILEKGSPITEKEIETAKIHDRLVSMALNCV